MIITIIVTVLMMMTVIVSNAISNGFIKIALVKAIVRITRLTVMINRSRTRIITMLMAMMKINKVHKYKSRPTIMRKVNKLKINRDK